MVAWGKNLILQQKDLRLPEIKNFFKKGQLRVIGVSKGATPFDVSFTSAFTTIKRPVTNILFELSFR